MSNKNEIVTYTSDGSFSDIIHTVGKWKIIDLQNLHQNLSIKIAYRTLKAKVNVLQKNGVIAAKFLGTKQKYVYLTNKGISHTPFDKTYEPASVELTHDLLVGRVSQELLKYSNVSGATMYHQIENKHINPDANISINANGKAYTAGIEVELNRKSKRRIISKYSKYGVSQDYDYCFYISNSERLMKTYQLYLEELQPEVQKKFFFISDEKLKQSGELFKRASCYHNGKKINLEAIFGEKLQ